MGQVEKEVGCMSGKVSESPGLDMQGERRRAHCQQERWTWRRRDHLLGWKGPSLTFFIRKDSSSSLSTAKMFSMGMLQSGWSPTMKKV